MNQDELIKRIEELEEEIKELRKEIMQKREYTEEEAERCMKILFPTSRRNTRYDLTILTETGDIFGGSSDFLKNDSWQFPIKEALREGICYFQIIDFKDKVMYYAKSKDIVDRMIKKIKK
jgi:hypothetical protein